jgi:hypothetical protein
VRQQRRDVLALIVRGHHNRQLERPRRVSCVSLQENT